MTNTIEEEQTEQHDPPDYRIEYDTLHGGQKMTATTEEPPKDDRLIFRCNRADKLELKAEAERRNESLSETIRRKVFQEEGANQN